MLSYTSFTFFLCYFGGMYILAAVLPCRYKYLALTLGSWIFYTVSSGGHVIPLVCETAVIYADGIILSNLTRIYKEKRSNTPKEERNALKEKYLRYKRIALLPGVISVVAFLLVCKYQGFFIGIFNAAAKTDVKPLGIVQPLGLSFFSLEAISYIADVYYGRLEAEKNPLKISLYLSFAFTCVEGPVVRYGELLPQISEGKKFDAHACVSGAVRVTYGLIKKIVIADRAAIFADSVFNGFESYGGSAVLFAILFYVIQLYSEFSGITDVSIGLCEMMEITLPENFRNPFFSKSISEFWQRWHITLGSWLRDYIFYPVSLSKPFKALSKGMIKKCSPYYAGVIPSACALFFVWLANGFWHGSGWKYIFYGFYYYTLMMLAMFAEPLFVRLCAKTGFDRDLSKAFSLFRIARTAAAVYFGMLIFRAESLTAAAGMLKSVFRGSGMSLISSAESAGTDIKDLIVIAAGVLFVLAVEYCGERGTDIREKIMKLPYHAKFIIFLTMIFTVIIFGAYGEEYGTAGLVYAGF